MISMLDVYKKKEFREKLECAMVNHSDAFSIPTQIPLLYKYSSFSEYAVKNLLIDGLSLSIIASFNDSYDSNISFGDIREQALKEYDTDKRIFNSEGYEPCISVENWIEHIKVAQEAYRGFCSDSHCLCLSEKNNSTLMWSHYADCNRGICIEYDFESIKSNPLYYALFPVCYTKTPINVYDFVNEHNGDFSIEVGILISVLNKATCWDYEHEWRLICLNEALGKRKVSKYLSLSNIIKAKSIMLGQNFLDNFIPELNKDGEGGADNAFDLMKLLIICLKAKSIPLYQMTSMQNDFSQSSSVLVDLDFLQNFIEENKEDNNFTLQNRKYLYISYREELGIIEMEYV